MADSQWGQYAAYYRTLTPEAQASVWASLTEAQRRELAGVLAEMVSCWRSSPAHLLLLSKFRKAASPDSFRNADYWEAVLAEPPLTAIERFVKEGALEAAELPELVDFKFRASELKTLLKERGLKASGRKEELAQRLIEHDPQSMREATKAVALCRCTAEGVRLAEHYLDGERAKREAFERDTLALLTKGQLPQAVGLVVQFESSQVFPRAVGVNSGLEMVRLIFEKIPGILRGVTEDKLAELRCAAAMMQLWGATEARRWLPENFETGIRLDSETAARMIVSHASHLQQMQDYRSSIAEIKQVEVLGTYDENICSECRKINGKKYKLDSVPEIPYPKCTSESGCRCTTLADV